MLSRLSRFPKLTQIRNPRFVSFQNPQISTNISFKFGGGENKSGGGENKSRDWPTSHHTFFGIFVLVKEKYAVLLHRLGKYHKTLDPGLNIKIPYFDEVAFTQDLREQAIEISSQMAVTKDNVALHIDGVLYIQISDPIKASYGIQNVKQAIVALAQTTMRSEIGKITLDRTFEEREVLNSLIVEAISCEVAAWGVSCIRYEIKDIEAPPNIQESMILQAEAERQKRANILKSEGERQVSINLAEAEKQSKQLRAKGEAEAVIKQIAASSEALKQIAGALLEEHGGNAGNFVLAQRYINGYEKMGKKGNMMVLNTRVLDAKNNVGESYRVLDVMMKEQEGNLEPQVKEGV